MIDDAALILQGDNIIRATPLKLVDEEKFGGGKMDVQQDLLPRMVTSDGSGATHEVLGEEQRGQ